jgi:imidazolonepropionase-like amidohydrolase
VACFEHIPEAFKITKELKEAGVGTSVFIDSWAYKIEAAEGIALSAAYCTRQGLLVSLNSDGGERIRRLFNEAGKTLRYGRLTEDEALRLITINPAIQLGLDKIVGSLEIGKHGDLAVFNEHPLSAYARCDLTVIEGDIYFDRAAYLQEREEAAKKAKPQKQAGGVR